MKPEEFLAIWEEYAQHHGYCKAWCPGDDEHGGHLNSGQPCTCGYDDARDRILTLLT